jgi:hypothetical protein
MLKGHEINTKADAELSRAQQLVVYPTEDLVLKVIRRLPEVSSGPMETRRQLLIARFLVDKALKTLPNEMEVRGVQTVLEAIQKMEDARDFVEGALAELPDHEE